MTQWNMTQWKLFRLVAAVILALLAGLGAAMAAPDDAAYDRLLAKYVVASSDGVNRVNYAAWKANAADVAALDGYIASIEATALSKLPRNEQFAAWANLYNAVTLKVVIAEYPVKSIRDIKSTGTLDPKALIGPWVTKRVTVEGRKYSLDDIENAVLRANWKEPRVHYAVNCASYGCPNLQPKAWRGASLDADLTAAAKAYVNHPRGVSVAGDALHTSSIYKWFKTDFDADGGVLAHLQKYADADLAAALAKNARIAGDDYSWALNAVGSTS